MGALIWPLLAVRPKKTRAYGILNRPLAFTRRDDDVQVLHRFGSRKQAEAYLTSDLFNKDVVVGLKPLLKAAPEIRLYTAD